MMKKSKKTLSLLLAALLLLTSLTAAPAAGAAALPGGHSQTRTTDNSRYAAYSKSDIPTASVPLDGSGKRPDMCVPGLSEADGYIPQGMTYFKEKDWILISAYDGRETGSSVVYALDFSTGAFTAQFNLLKMNGSPLMAHVGGIACSPNNLYIADSGSKISYIPLSELEVDAGTVKDVSVSGTADLSAELTGDGETANTSYASFGDGMLWTGNHYAENTVYGNKANVDSGSILLGYRLSGASSEEEWGVFTSLVGSPSVVIPLDGCGIDSVQCATVSGGKVYISSSYGRKYASSIYIAELSATPSIPMTVAGRECMGSAVSRVKSYSHLPMAEGLFVKDGYMYNLFESAAYRYSGEEDEVCPDPTDVIWRFGVSSKGAFVSFFAKIADFMRYIVKKISGFFSVG